MFWYNGPGGDERCPQILDAVLRNGLPLLAADAKPDDFTQVSRADIELQETPEEIGNPYTSSISLFESQMFLFRRAMLPSLEPALRGNLLSFDGWK